MNAEATVAADIIASGDNLIGKSIVRLQVYKFIRVCALFVFV